MFFNRLLFQSVLVLASVATAKADFFEEYLNGKVFGPSPAGPCVNRGVDGGVCSIKDFTGDDLPETLGNTRFCLIEVFGSGFVCEPLKKWLSSGELVELWDMQCEDLGIGEVTIAKDGWSLGNPPANPAPLVNRVTFPDIRQKCSGQAEVKNLILEKEICLIFCFDVRITANYVGRWNTETPDGEDGVTLAFDLELLAESEGFTERIPNDVEVSNCELTIDQLGLSLVESLNIELTDLSFISIDLGALSNLVISLLLNLFNTGLCGVLEQAGTIENPNGPNTEPGVLQVLLNDVNTFYDDNKEPQNINIEQYDQDVFNGLSSQEKIDAADFTTNPFVELVSVTINEFLAKPTESGELAVVTAIKLLTEPDGFFDLVAVRDGLDLEVEIPAGFANITIKFNKFGLGGLDTITDLALLDNNYGGSGVTPLKYTLRHSFDLDRAIIDLTIGLKFERGSWVTFSPLCGNVPVYSPTFNDDCVDDIEEFSFDFGLDVTDVNFNAATTTAFNLDELSEKQIGQVIDFSRDDLSIFGVLESSAACISPSIYHFSLPSLNFSVQDIGQAIVDNFSGEGLTQAINDGADIVTTILNPVFAKDLPFLLQDGVREFVNEFLETSIVNAPGVCEPYSPSNVPDYVQYNKVPVSLVFTPINEVLGDFTADANLNVLLDTLLNYYSDESTLFPFQETITDGDWELKPSYKPLINLPPFETAFSAGSNAFMKVADVRINNFNSIYALELNATDNPNGFALNFSIGEPADNLQIQIDFEVLVDDLDINEKFTLDINVNQLEVFVDFVELLVDIEKIYQLRFNQLGTVPCLVSILDGLSAPKRSLILESLDFGIINRGQVVAGPVLSSDFRTAVNQLETEFIDPPTPESNIRINSALDVVWNALWNSAAKVNYSGTPATCDDEDSTIQDVIELALGFGVPNITGFVDECLAPIVPNIPAEEMEKERLKYQTSPDELGKDYFDLEDSFIFTTLEYFLDLEQSGEANLVQRILIGLANSTGNPISDILVLEEGDIVTLELELNTVNPIFALLGLPALSVSNDDGYLAELQLLRVRGLNTFLNNLKFFDILSTFTSGYRVQFDDNNPLDVEIIGFVRANATYNGDPPADPPIEETIKLDLQLKNVDFDLELLTAVDSDKFINLTLAHFIDVNNDQTFKFAETAVDCFFYNFYEGGIFIRNFTLDIAEIEGPTLTIPGNTLISPGLEGIANELIILFSRFYLDALPNICQNCIRTLVNDQLDFLWRESTKEGGRCPRDVQPNQNLDNPLFDFANSPLIYDLQQFLEGVLFADDCNLLNRLTNVLFAEPFFQDYIGTGAFNLFYNGQSYGDIEVKIKNLELPGWDTFTYGELLNPSYRGAIYDQNRRLSENEALQHVEDGRELAAAVAPEDEPYVTQLRFEIDGPANIKSQVDIIGTDLFANFDGQSVVLNQINIDLELTNVTLALQLLLKIDLYKALLLRWNTITSFDEIPCLFIPVRGFQVIDFEFDVDNIDFTGGCAGVCDAPLLKPFTDGVTVTTKPDPGESRSELGQELADIVTFSIIFVEKFISGSPLQTLIDAQIETAEDSCRTILESLRGIIDGEPDPLEVFPFLSYCFIGYCVVAGAATLYLYPLHKKRRQKVLDEFSKKNMTFSVEDEVKLLQEEMKSLFQHDSSPYIVKFGLPLACLINIGALIVAILFSGALNIILTLLFLGMSTNPVVLVPFTVISTINDIWASGAWPLALLIAVGSCAWPVIKNAILIIIWFTPTTLLSSRTRIDYLEKLDILGKWSFLDVFVVVLTLAALKTYVVVSEQARLTFLADDFFIADVNVTPERGIVLLCIVASTSLLVNHIMVYYHEKCVEMNRHMYDRIAQNPKATPKLASVKRSISDYKFNRRKVSKRATYVLLIVNCLSGIFVSIGVFLPLITFKLDGVLGLVLELFNEDFTYRTFSIFDLGVLITEAPKNNIGDDIILVFFQFLYFLVSIIFPILQWIALAILLKGKFNLKNMKFVLNMTMIASFWAVLECILTALIATIYEIGLVSVYIVDFITGDRCTDIRAILELFLGEEDGSCLDVSGLLEPESVLLFIGVVVQLFTLVAITVLANAVYEDRYYNAFIKSGLRPRDPKPKKLGRCRRFIIKILTVPRRSDKANFRKSNPATLPPPSTPTFSSLNGNQQASVTRQNSRHNSRRNQPVPGNRSLSNPIFQNENSRAPVGNDDDLFDRMLAQNSNQNSKDNDSDFLEV